MSDYRVYSFINDESEEFKIIERGCNWCGKDSVIYVNSNDYQNWYYNAKYIQDSFPYLSAPNRELIKTGTHPECWDEIFGSDEDE